ncbi:MAG: FG-GAP-like repeat-containing protein [Bacteroidetes bacterium]|nr:FG-GAP-like repeat-containing protein [Bacteroidota bacterium]
MRSIHLLAVILVFLAAVPVAGQPVSFRKINTGTKSDIHAILRDHRQGVYFLTDKIYRLDNNAWKKLDFPVEGKIYTFYPVSPHDIWFTVIPFTSTCLLYHYRDGITENIRPPFANYITAMYFITPDKAFFAGVSDMAVYENGKFTVLPPLPVRYNILKIFGKDLSSFWILTEGGELFEYGQGKYKSILNHKAVSDFCFYDYRDGYVLANDELYRVHGSGVKLVLKNADLKLLKKITLLPDGTILMAGTNGLVMSYSNGKLARIGAQSAGNLTNLVSVGTDDIWICGKNGRLLYAGKKQFPEYIEDNQGFSSHKLSSIGLSSDDEYGVAMADFTGDGKQDIYTVRIYEQNRLYLNNIVSTDRYDELYSFQEECVKRSAQGAIGPADHPEKNELKIGISAADIDNDNDQDIYLCYLNSINKLLLNQGNGYFRNVSAQRNRACSNMKRSNSAAFADVDNDGDLDLFVANEEGTNRLFMNDGTGHFTDITATSGLMSVSGGMCASFADVNNDGLPDLCVTFWYPSNKLYINESVNGKIHFRDVSAASGLAGAAPSKSNAVVFADVNNDGSADLFIANRNTGNKLYLNNGRGIFTDKTRDYFQPDNYMSNGAVFADFDLDGFLDLYVTNVGENVLYKNMNGLGFKDVTASFGAELSGYCTGCATGDIDNDGDPDMYVANYINGNSKLFVNITEKKSFIKVKLHGVRSNRDAIGTRVWLYKSSGTNAVAALAGYRELNGGGGYCSVSAKEMIFGVEKGEEYRMLVKFPSSPDTLRFDHISAGKTLDISELTGFPALYAETVRQIARFFTDSENQPEIIKYLLIFCLLVFYNLKQHVTIRNLSLIRWLGAGFIFAVFVFVNEFFLYQWISVRYFIAPVIVLILLVMEHLFVDRILLRQFAQQEKQELREKLSRDLHDDLASTLGSISIYAETFKSMDEPSHADFKKLSVKIAGLTQSALQSISDIIWMTSPRNDSLQSLISKTSNYMLEITTDNKINFRSDIDIPDDPIILQEKVRNDAFLILKEGLHNIIRHSGAGNVAFSAVVNENLCIVRLRDDGAGMDEAGHEKKGSHGNGLINMRKRALESGIGFDIHSARGKGTEIVLQLKI